MTSKKLITTAVFSLFFCMNSIAQNAIGVTNIQSPQQQNNYSSNEKIDIRVFVQNKGPNELRATDSLHFEYNVATNDTMLFFQKKMLLGVPLDSGDGAAFTLYKDYNFSVDNYYSVCAEVSGTRYYPTNTAKQRSACSYFPVSLSENKLTLDNLYYADGSIYYELSKAANLSLKLFNISGRLLFEKVLHEKTGQINCADLSPALYFVTVNDQEGNHKTVKMLVR